MNNFEKAIRIVEKAGVKIDCGLTLDEINKAETFYNIKFHPDHRGLIRAGLFADENGYNWHDYSDKNIARIREMLDWPQEGILFDIEFNNFWMTKLGQKPADLTQAKEIFTNWYKLNVPRLIPIYSHRYMSSEPDKLGAPVYSVHQTDIIYYGNNIFSYLKNEFRSTINIEYPKWRKDDTPFWSEILHYDYDQMMANNTSK